MKDYSLGFFWLVDRNRLCLREHASAFLHFHLRSTCILDNLSFACMIARAFPARAKGFDDSRVRRMFYREILRKMNAMNVVEINAVRKKEREREREREIKELLMGFCIFARIRANAFIYVRSSRSRFHLDFSSRDSCRTL